MGRSVWQRVSLLAVGLLAACSSSSGGSRSAADVGNGSADRARVRAALDVLAREIGHPVDVRVDAALVEGNPLAGARVAEIIEDLARDVSKLNPQSPESCKRSCPPWTSLAMAADARSLWATVQRVELRYDALAGKRVAGGPDRDVELSLNDGRLTFHVKPDGLYGAIELRAAQTLLFHETLGRRFAGRAPASVGPGELNAYTLFLAGPLDQAEAARNATSFVFAYPRLAEPARSVAQGEILRAKSFIDDDGYPRYGSPELESAWSLWYRTYAASLDEPKLRAAASLVFGRDRGDLPGLTRFEYAWDLITRQAHGPGTQETAALACAVAERCYGPLYDFFVDRRAPERRRRLAGALLAARDPALVAFVTARLFEQRDANKSEWLALLGGDPPAWSAAFTMGLMSLNSVYAEDTVKAWKAGPALRAPMLRALGAVATLRPPAGARAYFNETPLGHAANAFADLARQVCVTPERAAFITLATQQIPPDNPLWQHRLNGGKACDELLR